VADAMRSLAVRAHEKGLELLWRVAPQVPDGLVGDAGRLRQVLINLVGNAIKFTDQGEVVVEVDARQLTAGEADLRFDVRDTGIGIAADKQRAIFDAFVQADGTTTRKHGGTGLGLTISSRLVALMRGTIGVESEAGRGSTFHFTARFGVLAAAEAGADVLVAPDLEGLRVLVADDNATNRRILQETLAAWKTRPTMAEDGPAALAALEAAAREGDPYRLLLLDMMMPGMDGLEVARRARSLPGVPPAPAVILSSAGSAEDRSRDESLIQAWLTKPVRQSDLLDAIMSLPGPHRPGATADAPAHAAYQVPGPAAGGGGRILLAEDNIVNQRLALRLLERNGHVVTVAKTGLEAVELLDAGRYDVVLMDVQMPEMSGFQATAEIRRRERMTGRHVPIIAMTAHAMAGDRDRCLAAGMDDYVSKPIDAPTLFAAIERMMSRQAAPAAGTT